MFPRLVLFERTAPPNDLERDIRNIVFEVAQDKYLNVATLEPWVPDAGWKRSDDEASTLNTYMLPETKQAIDRNFLALVRRAS